MCVYILGTLVGRTRYVESQRLSGLDEISVCPLSFLSWLRGDRHTRSRRVNGTGANLDVTVSSPYKSGRDTGTDLAKEERERERAREGERESERERERERANERKRANAREGVRERTRERKGGREREREREVE